VILGISGGVDSSVAASLLNRAVGKNLTCIFIDNGLLRKNEYETVMESYKDLGLNITESGQERGSLISSKESPIREEKKNRGQVFIEVFDEEAQKVKDVKWLAQGTIYPMLLNQYRSTVLLQQ